jgi:hypothetical protein
MLRSAAAFNPELSDIFVQSPLATAEGMSVR